MADGQVSDNELTDGKALDAGAVSSEVSEDSWMSNSVDQGAESHMQTSQEDLLSPSDEQAELPAIIDETEHHKPVVFSLPTQHRGRRISVIICFICLMIVGSTLAIYRLLLRQGSFGQVKLAGVKIERGIDHNKLLSDINDKFNEVTYTVIHDASSSSRFTPSDAGIEMLASPSLDKALNIKERGSLWQRLQWWRVNEVDAVLAVDRDKLAAFVDEKMTVIEAPSTNATLAVEDGVVKLSSSSPGKGFRVSDAQSKLISAASKVQPQTFKLEATALEPHVSDYDVADIKAKLDKTLDQTVKFNVAGKVFTATRTDIGSWVSPISLEDKKPNLEFNSGEIEAFIDKIAKNYVNPARSEIIMHKSDGTEQLLVSGKNGTDVIGKDAIATEVSQSLLAGKPVDIALNVGEQVYSKISAEDYDKWVVVDLTNKYMELYEKSKLVNTFKVSGGAPATPTVLGQYKILYKLRTQDMRGLNADGTSYFQPRVEYVNYFYGGYAVHGVYWRPDYWFGQINSSHGCVGLRTSEAKWFYDWAPVGTVVITHI